MSPPALIRREAEYTKGGCLIGWHDGFALYVSKSQTIIPKRVECPIEIFMVSQGHLMKPVARDMESVSLYA